MERFTSQFKVHVVQLRNVTTLSSVKQREYETLRDYLTRLNAIISAVQKSNSSIFLAAVAFGVTNITDFKKALERNPSVDLVDFYYQVEKYLRREDAKAKNGEVNVVHDGGPFKAGSRKDKGKGKADDSFRASKQQKRKSNFPFTLI